MTAYFALRDDTIAAIATPPGEGGVAIIRVSGTQAFPIVAKIFSGDVTSYPSHTAHYGKLQTLTGEPVDTVLLLVMRNPRSFTGEDVAEIHCHGGSLISRKVLETVCTAGARLAHPGEFSFRAFMNGKLDLAQAEAIQSMISAKNELSLESARKQLEGQLSKKIDSFQKELIDLAAILEAWVDFPEEGIEFAPLTEVCEQLAQIQSAMQKLLASFHEGRKIHEGLSLCLIGRPNVGKSSLMNALLGKERAIVTPIPGTTRDLIEEDLILNGLHFRLTDTAGIRLASDLVEQEGIKRSKQALQEADLTLLVLDATAGLKGEDRELLQQIVPQKTIAVWNKIDLICQPTFPPLPVSQTVALSATQGTGCETLKKAIDQLIWSHGPPSKEELLITNQRHKEALSQAILHCQSVHHGLLNGVSPEFLSFDMRQCLVELGKVIGLDITEDILSAIFAKFCIGK